MKDALEALVHEMEYVLTCINAHKVPFDGDDFHEALRLGKEALAQPEQEPVAWGFQNSAITGSNRWMMLREEIPANDQYGGALWTPLYTTPPQPKEPEQEPVAIRHSFDGYGWQYVDSGFGSGWTTWAKRYPDAEFLYDVHSIKGEA